MSAEGVKIVQMQTILYVQVDDNYPLDEGQIAGFNSCENMLRQHQLAQALADGYEIANVTVGGNERGLLTVWTLKLASAADTSFIGDTGISSLYQFPDGFDQRVNTLIEEALRKVVKGAYPHVR